MKKIVAGLVVVLGFCACAHRTSGTLDVNKALDYCAEQTQRSLVELKGDSGIDYTMMPRNVMADEHHWNCRKATKEEWCAGFWPGVLWYDYEYTQDKNILEEAEKFTASLEFLSRIPAYDHIVHDGIVGPVAGFYFPRPGQHRADYRIKQSSQ